MHIPIKSLLIGMLACSAMVACSNEDVLESNEQENQKAGNSYLAVKLVSPSADSRALGAYADGNANEQAVTNARFYLFKSNGEAYTITDESGNTKNFVDATSFEDEGVVSPNVETILSTVLVIDKSQVAPPAKILAVLNYPTTILKDESKSLSQLQDILDNFGTINDESNGAPYTTSGKFVMSNSAYVDAAGNIVYATPIAAENIKTDPEDAHAAPVKIYVERVAAKVQTQVDAAQTKPTGKEQTFFVKDGEYYAFTGQIDAEDKPIYAHLKGWRVTNITSKSKLIKSLETTAEANYAWIWNNPTYYRSYWADDANENLSWAWNFNETNRSFADTDNDDNWEYYNENTKNEEGENSQLLVAAEFVTFNGETPSKPQPIAEWYGVKYTLNNLKTHIAGALADKLFTYDEENDKFISITGDAITFTQVSSTEESGRYISKIGVVEGTYFYKSNDTMKQYGAEGNTQLSTVINALQPAKIWGNIVNGDYVGGGYYYVDIEHETTEEGTIYGLVRNHWYLLTLKNLNGLGTPVYNPEEVIITEKPDTDYSYISAEINVLSWRMVSQNVNLQ